MRKRIFAPDLEERMFGRKDMLTREQNIFVMTMILRERYNANRPKSDGNSLTMGQKNNGLTLVPFGDENFDTVEQDFPVEYVQAKPTVW